MIELQQSGVILEAVDALTTVTLYDDDFDPLRNVTVILSLDGGLSCRQRRC